MGSGHVALADLLDHLARSEKLVVAEHLGSCPACAALAEKARRLLAAGRRLPDAPRVTRRTLRLAMRAFRAAQKTPATLHLVLDSLLRPAPALRARTASPTRFLRYQGALTVELQITPAARGRVNLHGQTDETVSNAIFVAGKMRRRTRVSADGTFVFRGLPRGKAELMIGATRIAELEL